MLVELNIRNFALIEALSVRFGEGLNVLTGATGAGKSIIVGAINLLLGERAGAEVVRTGADSAVVEALFDGDQELILRREIMAKGGNRCYANGELATLSRLRELGDRLMDLHGQHQHQSLLQVDNHRELVDNYGDLISLRAQVAEAFGELEQAKAHLGDLRAAQETDREKRELYRFQLKEIDEIGLRPGEDDELEREWRILKNAEQLRQFVSLAYALLYEGENPMVEGLATVEQELAKAELIDETLGKYRRECEQVRFQLDEIARTLASFQDSLDCDPLRLEEVGERLDALRRLKKKYGGALDEVLKHRQNIEKALREIDDKAHEIDELAEGVGKLREKCGHLCWELSKKRRDIALGLEKRVVDEVTYLGMAGTRFRSVVTWKEDEDGPISIEGVGYQADARGMDRVEFLISPNPGEDLRPLAKIASGGEISRLMLALKSILASADRIPTLVFDEIDVGIGGEVAQRVGGKLKELAQSHQVICITHLHQIASQADEHFRVWKELVDGRTVTRIERLRGDERVNEIARMIGGKRISKTALDHAKEMVDRKE